MTVLNSLLSSFRKSRSTRKNRRSETGRPELESLEQRLLLTNPDLFESNPGAPITVYLDFDGHVENDPAWTSQFGQINRPAFSLDANTTTFTEQERATIEEIYLRVSEDFAPFSNVNVTTIEPSVINPGETVLVSIGGNDGPWPNGTTNDAFQDGFNNGNLSNTVFVMPRELGVHPVNSGNARPNELGRFVANQASEAVLIAMNIEEVGRGQDAESSALVDLGALSLGWRDVLSNQVNDDLDVLTTPQTSLVQADDDHGNNAALATSIVPRQGVENISGLISTNDDTDFFHVNTQATTATFSVSGLDLTQLNNNINGAPFTDLGLSNAGSNLDLTLSVFDVNGGLLATSSPAFDAGDPNASLKASVTLDLPAGDFYVEVNNGGEYGNLGRYTLSLDGIDTQTALAVPPINSNPGAPVTLFLDFNGARVTEDELIAQRSDGIAQSFYVTPYDTDGDRSSFSAEEEADIIEIFNRVAEDFVPFDVNVTTIDPFLYGRQQGHQQVIGGDGSWFGSLNADTFGFAELGTFGTGAGDNMGIVFSDLLADNKERALETSAILANALGVENGDDNGNRVAGFPAIGPIGGDASASLRDVFQLGTSSTGASIDPASVITSAVNRISFRADDFGDDDTTAATINLTPDDEVIRGVIEEFTDVDYFAFETRGGDATISITGLDLRFDPNGDPVPGITNPGANFDPVITLLDENNQVIRREGDFPAVLDITDSDPETLNESFQETLAPGRYFIAVSNQRSPGISERDNVGSYTITLEGVDGTDVSLSFVEPSIAENEGTVVGVGRLDRPNGQPTSLPVTVNLRSNDTSELIVPDTVTIQPGSDFALFDVTAVDDSLLDGEQRVRVEAWIGGLDVGVLNSTAILRVSDHETIEATISPADVFENLGAGGAQLTISRSNTDTGPENHWAAVGDELREYDASGNLIQTITIEWPVGVRPQFELTRDITLLEDGSIAVFNGVGTAFLSVYNPTTAVWEHFGETGLSADAGGDVTIGGLTTVGDFVFLSDFESQPGDPRGIVRFNTFTGEVRRFADQAVGSRFFTLFVGSIDELDPVTGETLNSFAIPSTGGFTTTGQSIAFDGQDLWVRTNRVFTNSGFELLRVSPDTGELLETHFLPGVFNNNGSIAVMDGLVYILEDVGFFNDTTLNVYDPVTRQFTAAPLALESLNPGITFGNNVAALPNLNQLVVTGTTGFFTTSAPIVYLLDPESGLVQPLFAPPNLNSLFFTDGLTTLSDFTVDGVRFDNAIYIEAFGEISAYELNGNPIDLEPATVSPGDPLPNGPHFATELAGGDVPGVTAEDQSFRDLAIGLNDRLLYGLLDSGSEIAVYNPETLARITSIQLTANVNSIAVDANGNILGGGDNGVLWMFDPTGGQLGRVDLPVGDITDVETNVSRSILVSGNIGVVSSGDIASLMTSDDTGFTSLENVGAPVFTALGRNQFLPTGDLFVDLSSSDLSELEVPDSVRIPVGQTSITIPIDVVDDNLLDGTQVVAISGTSDNYVSVPLNVDVLDAETVGVEVIPDEVAETEGVVPNGVRVFRTDIDGPFEVAENTTVTSSGQVPITDRDITLVPVEVRQQQAVITDIDVTINLEHSFIPDLDVFLVSPSGTRVELFTDLGSNGSLLTNATLDDEAAIRVIDADAPFTGRFIPEQLLSAFDGQDPSGTWTLEIIDDNVTDSGILFDWTLDIDTLGLSETIVTVVTSDASEAIVNTITVTIPPATAEVFIDLEALDDDIVDGTQPTTISAGSTNLVGFDLGSDVVDVLDVETLTIEVSNTQISEGAGAGATTATITRSDSAMTDPLVVTLVSNDPTEISVPVQVIIPVGQPSVTFDIDAVDDALFDGDQQADFAATAPGYQPETSEEITVIDQESRLVLSTLAQNVAEDSGLITIGLSRLDATDLSFAQEVVLQSSDLSELTVPATFIIPVGAVSTTFTATVLPDDLLDGPQTVTISASDPDTVNPTVNSGSLDVIVEDAEFVAISIPTGNSLPETAGTTVTAVATISAENPNDTIISLSVSDLTELNVPAQVTIPAGETSVEFEVTSVDDSVVDRTQVVSIIGTATGYRDASLAVSVTDHEPPIGVGPSFVTEDSTPTIVWAPVDGATRYDLWVNDVSRNITQLYRLENEPAATPLFSDDFDGANGFTAAGWNVNGASIDDVGLNEPSGTLSARLNGSPNGNNSIETPVLDLSQTPAGVQLKFSFQRTGGGESPGASEDLIVSYRDVTGQWVVLDRQAGDGPDGLIYETVALQLPEEALHAGGGIRFESIGKTVQDDVEGVYDDWFIDDVELTENGSFTPDQQLGIGRYRYWVRAYDDLEQPGAWSAGNDFLVQTRPTITSPVGQNAQSGAPVIQWTTLVDSSYDLWVNNLTTGESQVIRERNLETTSFATATAGLGGGTYRAWVRGTAPDGTTGFWSSPVTFSILSAPTGLQPSGSTFDRTPELSWAEVPGAEFYFVWLSRRDPGEDPEVILTDRFVQGTSRSIDQDLEFGRYFFWVQAVGEDGSRSAWSRAAEFNIGGRPEIVSPVAGSTISSTPTFTWTGIAEASHYEFWLNRIDVPMSQVVYNPNVPGTSLTITNPLEAGTYRLWVRAISDMGEQSFWSRPVDFTVATNDTAGTDQTTLLTSVSVELDDLQSTFVASALEEYLPLKADEVQEEVSRVESQRSSLTVQESDADVAVDAVMADAGIFDLVNSDPELVLENAPANASETQAKPERKVGAVLASALLLAGRRRKGRDDS